MKKILITSILIFIFLASILHITYATNSMGYVNNIANDSLLEHAQNAAKDYNQAMKNEAAALNEYMAYLNSSSQTNNTNLTELPKTGLSTNIYLIGGILAIILIFIALKLVKYRDI